MGVYRVYSIIRVNMGTQDIWGFTGNTVYIRVSDLVYLRDNILRTLHEDYQMDNQFVCYQVSTFL